MTVDRWNCTSYCLCKTRKGHFEKASDDGVWVLYADAQALEQENERLQRENGVVREEIDRLLDGLARIKEHSDGTSIAWTLAYEALHNRPYSYPGCSGEPQEKP